MKLDRTLLFSLLAMAVLLSCSASGAREGNTPPATKADAGATGVTPTNYREALNGVDFSGLDEAGKERALKILNEQPCDCGCPFGTIAACRVKDAACPRSPGLARAVIDAVKSGKSDGDVIAALKATPKQAAATPKPAEPTGPVAIETEGVESKGNPKAAATLVEYADFQCPYCSRGVPLVQELMGKYGDDLRFVYKHLPLVQIHPFAEPASRASLAAGRQGKFWEMYDVLYQNSRALDEASLRKYAQDLKLDMAKFDKDRLDPSLIERIRKDTAEATRIGVTGTPTFYINGVKVPSADVQTMGRMIDAAKSGGDVAAVAGEIKRVNDEQVRRQQEAVQLAATRVHEIDITGSPVKGDPKAPITIVEFSDYQCPFCAGSEELVKQVLDAYPGKVKLVFKHLPLTSIHPNARPAAIAAVAAMQHGKFWELHELLFKNSSQLTRENLLAYGKQVGIEPAEMEKAFAAQATSQVVDKDVNDYMKTSLPMSTPSFFVNGRKVMQRDFDTFKRMIDEALKTSGAPAAS